MPRTSSLALAATLAGVLTACQTATPALRSGGVRPAPTFAAPWGLDVRRLPVGEQLADMTLYAGEQARPLGTVTYATRLDAPATPGPGRLIVTATQRFTQGPNMIDTLVVDVPGGRPIRYRNAFGDRQTIRVDYGPDGRIAGRVTRGGQTMARDTTVSGALLDAAQLRPLLPALPLAAGLRASIPAYDYQSGQVVVSQVEVADARVPGTDVAAWDVAYSTPSGIVSHVWIDRATRQTRRIETDLGGGRRYVEVFR